MYDVTIIGAGASGVMCALALKEKNKNLKVLLLEKNDKLGKKLSITGNGRCNLGNINNDISNFNSESDLSSFKRLLEIDDFDFLDVLDNTDDKKSYYDYLIRFGILITNEKEYLYPYSMQAISVCKSFERYLKFLNVEVKYNYDVLKVSKNENTFIINDDIKSKMVVIATGGKSYPKTGSTGFGYGVLKSFGHTITDLYPSLTYLKTDYKYIKDLQGVRVNAKTSLSVDGKIEKKEVGQVQFTRDSLSGICIFNMSRFLKLGKGKTLKDGFKEYEIYLDFMPEFSPAQVEDFLREQDKRGLSGESALNSVVKEKLARAVAGRILSDENPARQIKALKFTPKMPKGWETAQVTRGGVALSEVDGITMESRKVPGLYFAGEVLDYDGPCGGFNLNHAWITGIKAGRGLCTEFSR